MIIRSCGVCGVRIRVDSIVDKFCGQACAALQKRRDAADAAGLPITHPERHAITPRQKAIQQRALAKRYRR